jgi:UDP-2,3-diacylglucosamine pyrophosphatase LpxH
VQEVCRKALAVPPEIARKLAFTRGDEPEILEVGGARVLVTHGEQNDDWNRVDYPKLVAMDAKYRYAPGSALVKQILNPGVRAHGMRFLSLLKPDFQGAALSALAVDPSVAKQILKGSAVRMLAHLRARKNMAFTFDEEEAAGPDYGLSDRLGEAGLSDDEQDVLEAVLDEGSALSFSDEDEGILRKARAKIARKALAAYVGLQRKLAGTEGDTYFQLDPAEEEWTEAARLAAKYKVSAVIIGHTHAARFRQDEGLLYVNTGTWIGLMRLPSASAPDETWLAFLEELRKNKALLPERQKLAPIERRFTAVLLEPHAEGGAAVSLVEWKDGALTTLGAGRVPPAA